MVNAILERLLADDLRAVEGSYVRGELHVHDSLVNEVLQQLVRPPAGPAVAPPPTPQGGSATAALPDLGRIRSLLQIDELAFESRNGKNILKFSVRR